jgi:hypothetical protein
MRSVDRVVCVFLDDFRWACQVGNGKKVCSFKAVRKARFRSEPGPGTTAARRVYPSKG